MVVNKEDIKDPVERIIAYALNIGTNTDHTALDFKLQGDVYIECKQFHSDRVSEQLKRADNIILIQGIEAAKTFANLIAPDAATPKWQPIETAPKDGTPVLVVEFGSKHYPAIAVFSEYAVPLFRKPRWFSFHPSMQLWFKPTHWMSLPDVANSTEVFDE